MQQLDATPISKDKTYIDIANYSKAYTHENVQTSKAHLDICTWTHTVIYLT